MKNKTKLQAGFSLIELLVVIAIIGTLAGVVMVSMQSARQKARDAKRAADIKQLASALEAFFTTNNGYPVQASPAVGVPGLGIDFIGQIPVAPTPEESNCVGQNDYLYQSEDGLGYTVTFCLGAPTGDYGEGPHALTQRGVQ